MNVHLQEKFVEALNNEGMDRDAVSGELTGVVERYNERHRYYHNLEHIIRLLGLCEELQFGDPDLILAVVYHDIIYRLGSSKNEAKSAAFARNSLERLNLNSSRIYKVSEMILATANHLDPPDDPLTQIFLDLDMSILGAPREDYQAYAEGVRKEHFRVPGAIFRKHRHRFLEKILAAESIFYTELFREKYEAAARTNIKWELSR